MVVAALIAIGTALLVSCEKEVNISDNLPKTLTDTNPYAFVGLEHNQLLNYVGLEMADTLDFYSSKQTLSSNDKQILYSIFLEKSQEYMVSEKGMESQSASDLVSEFHNSFTVDTFNSIILNTTYDSVLTEIISSCDEDGNDIIEKIQNKENEVLLSFSTETSRDEIIMEMLAVLKYSVFYWKDAQINENNPWHAFVNSRNDSLIDMSDAKSADNFIGSIVNWAKRKWQKIKEKWQAVVLSDAAGAVIGAIKYGPTFPNIAIGAGLQSGATMLML